jgi:aldehyde dehydrogenase (NAD+)
LRAGLAISRYINSGHICTAPDHILVWPEVKDEFVHEVGEAIREFYGDDPKQSPDYGRVINDRNFERLTGFLGSGTIAFGGQTDPEQRYIAPTVLTDVSVDSPIMPDEVFGPILPVLEIDSVAKVIDWVNSHPRPLGLYIFAEDDDVAEQILDATESGDACVNDCSIQPLIPELPFGRGRELRDGQIPRPVRLRGIHQRPRRALPRRQARPRRQVPPYSEHERMHGIIGKLMP